jgi:hypothetical protein
MTYNPKVSGWPERLWRSNNEVDVARGNVPGAYPYNTFGERVTTGTVSGVIVRETGMPNTLTVPDGIRLTLVSTSASDTGTLHIRYLDGDLLERTEDVVLTGTTAVNTVANDIRAINNAYYIDGAGTLGVVTGVSGGVKYLHIPIGDIQYNTSMQRVPKGKRMMITGVYAGATSGSAAARAILKLETSFINGDSFAELGILHPVMALALQDNSQSLAGFGALPIKAGEWFGFTASTDKSATVVGGILGWMEDE